MKGHSVSSLSSAARKRRGKFVFAALGAVVMLAPLAILAVDRLQPSVLPPPTLSDLKAAAGLSPTVVNRLRLAVAYIGAKTPYLAVPVLQQVIAQDPTNAPAWNDLCVVHNEQADYALATAECDRALRLQPNFDLALNNRAWAQAKIDELTKRLAAQEQGPRDLAFFVDKSATLLSIGRYDEAIAAARQGLAIDPQSAVAANSIGVGFMLKHDPDAASTWFAKAMALDPRLVLARNNHTWAMREIAAAR